MLYSGDFGTRRLPSLVGLVVVLAAFAAFAGAAVAQTQTFTSTVPQSGFEDVIPPEGAPLTGPPYAFGNEIQDCESIESITVTLTLFDGDTGDPDELDFNDLILGLDGIDTGIPLNGFPESRTVTNTISGAPNNANQILAALKADGQLEGSILDSTPDDNLVGIPATFDTTLQIECGAAEEPGAGGAAPSSITQEKEQEAESGDITQTVQVENE